MSNLKPVNFIAETKTEEFKYLIYAWSAGFNYEQVKDELKLAGYYVSEKQYTALTTLLDEQLEHDIGGKMNETSP